MTWNIDHLGERQDGPWPSKWSQNWSKCRFFMKNISLMWDHCLFTASYLHPNMSQSPRGNRLDEFTSREDSRVGYDHQKVAKIEQKRGFKENFNHNSRQNSFDQLWLTCNCVGDSRVAYLQNWAKWEVSCVLLGPKIGPKLTFLQGFLEKPTNNAGPQPPNGPIWNAKCVWECRG